MSYRLTEWSNIEMQLIVLLVTLSVLSFLSLLAILLTKQPGVARVLAFNRTKKIKKSDFVTDSENSPVFYRMTSSMITDSSEQNSHFGQPGKLSMPQEDPGIEKMVIDRRRERTERSAGFCPKCGKPIQQSDQYCPGCGEKIVR